VRRLFLLAMAVVACQCKTALQTAKPDAGATVADASASLPDSPETLDQASFTDATGCVPLLPTRLGDLDPRLCSPSQAPAACGGGDIGAIVARSNACTNAWGDIPFQCMGWPAIAPEQEMVVLEASNCLNAVEIHDAQACEDRIEISYAEYVSCESCDGEHSALRAFLLPLDPRPVIATRHLIVSPCPPPAQSGGSTGRGGATGAGGTTGSGGSMATCALDGGHDCTQGPVNQITAGGLYLGHVPGGPSSLVPGQSIGAVEKCVPGLWDALQAQLFSGLVSAVDGSVLSECSFLLRRCTVTMVMPEEDDCANFGPIFSGVVAEGAFYYSYGVGSGIAYSVLGKLAWDGAALVRTQSPHYTNPSHGPPHLVVAAQSGRVVVYRARVSGELNEWHEPAELMGTLVDFGNHLGIVDSSGRELGETLP
jgi:hypothetical protein